MNKQILLISLLLCLSQTYAEDVLSFNVHYKPGLTYVQNIERTSQMNLVYSGSKDFMGSLDEKGIKNPTVVNSRLVIQSVCTTGKLKNEIDFPMVFQITKVHSDDGDQPLPTGMRIYGHAKLADMPVLDSVVADDISEEYKSTFMQTMQSMMSQISFPDKKLKIGESFTKKSPLKLPVGTLTLEMDIITTYKLLSIKDGVGAFDISQVYSMKSNVSNYTVKATGSGKGVLLYDIANNFYKRYQIDDEMNMNMKVDKVNMIMKVTSGFTQTTAIMEN